MRCKVKLPEGMSLDQVDYLSFWCVAFKVSFADGKLAAAPKKMLGEHLMPDAMNDKTMNDKTMNKKTMNKEMERK